MKNGKRIIVRSVRIKPNENNKTAREVAKYEHSYSKTGLIIGIITIFLGTILVGMGIKGYVLFEINSIKLNSSFPGLVLVIVGFLIIMVTRLKIDIS